MHLFVIFLLLFTFPACKNETRKGTDTVSSDSQKHKSTQPAPSENYTLLPKSEHNNGMMVDYKNGVIRGGDILSHQGMEDLKRLGVNTIFAISPNDKEKNLARIYEIDYVEITFEKEKGLSPENKSAFLERVKSGKKKFYIHCISGKNRGGTLAAFYRIHVDGWNFEKAKEEFIALGGDDAANPNLMNSVK